MQAPICPVCLELLIYPQVGTCGHSICGICKLRLNQETCPLCRKQSYWVLNFTLVEMMTSISSHFNFQVRKSQFDLMTRPRSLIAKLEELHGTGRVRLLENQFSEELAVIFILAALKSTTEGKTFSEYLSVIPDTLIIQTPFNGSIYKHARTNSFLFSFAFQETLYIVYSDTKDLLIGCHNELFSEIPVSEIVVN